MNVNLKRSLLAAGVVSSVAFASLAGAGAVSAATNTPATDGPTALIDKIAQKFNLNRDEVKAVFDEEHQTREAEHEKKVEERLNQAVTDGKITSEQKDKIIAKLDELRSTREANREAMKDKTDEERKAAMKSERAALEKWATDNGVPMEYLRMGGMRGGPHTGMHP